MTRKESNADILGVLDTETELNGNSSPDAYVRSQFSMFNTKLDVKFKDPRFLDKWYPYWFIDKEGRIAKALQSGYVMVGNDEIEMGGYGVTPRDEEAGEQVRRFSGVGERGDDQHYFLMKQPLELHVQHAAEREEYHRFIETSLKSGQVNRTPGDGRYTGADQVPGGTGLPKISMQQRLAR